MPVYGMDELKRRYRIEARLEQLPTLDRYAAYDLSAHESVCLSVLRNVSAVLRRRCLDAMQTLSQVDHPHLLPILDVGELTQPKRIFWTTPPCKSVASALGGLCESQTPAGFVGLVRQMLEALVVAHAAGVLHLRPRWGTVFSIDGRVCLGDFAVPASDSVMDEQAIPVVHANQATADVVGVIRMFSSQATVCAERGASSEWTALAHILSQLGIRIESATAFSAKQALDEARQLVFDESAAPGEAAVEHQHTTLVKTALRAVGVHLPVLAQLLREAPPSPELANTVVLHINHCLDDVFLLDRFFNDLFAKSVFVTVPYGRQRIPTDHPGTVYHSIVQGNAYELLCSARPLSQRAASFADAMTHLITRALEDSVLPDVARGRSLIIVEDGGYHYGPLRQLLDDGRVDADAVAGVVEQTMSGAVRCADAIGSHGVPYPAVTLARSNMKMRYEAFFIGRRVIDELAYLLYQYNEFLAMRRVLIIGYGIIGRSVALSLAGMACRVSVIDINEQVRRVADDDGYEVLSLEDGLDEFFASDAVVVGATGEASFTLSMLAQFALSAARRVFLVSASSKRTEFREVIDFFEGSAERRAEIGRQDDQFDNFQDVKIESNVAGLSYSFVHSGRRKDVVLVARGFPVNFFRDDGFSLTMGMIDPINAQLALLANYTVEARGRLAPNSLYALGCSPFPGLSVSEEDVIAAWNRARGSVGLETGNGGWWGFPIHPAEDYLRLRRLDGRGLVR